MGRVTWLASALISTNASTFTLAAVLLGIYVLISSMVPATLSASWIISNGGMINTLVYVLKHAMITPLAFMYALASAACLESVSSSRRGSIVVALTPVSRLDIVKVCYLTSILTAVSASLVGTYISSAQAFLTSGVKVSPQYPLMALAAYLAAIVPTMVFITSIALLTYSLTPVRRGIAWAVSIAYTIAVTISMGVTSGIKEVSWVTNSILSPGYGLANFIGQAMSGNALPLNAAMPSLITSLASLTIVTALAISIFNTYAEVSL